MSFVFQQPGMASLLEAIDGAAESAERGGGVFAFASKGGIEAYFGAPNIRRVLARRRGQFHIIVGIDAITNVEALLCLVELQAQFPRNLIVHAFYHEQPRSTFHPKFSWFEGAGNIRLVTGSGNLTLNGLGQVDPFTGNWEAFSVQTLNGGPAQAAMRQIEDWLAVQERADRLLPLTDERVRERAMFNARARFIRPERPHAAVHDEQDGAVLVDGVELETLEVLARELPKNRTGQADIGKAALTEFFGYGNRGNSVFVQFVSRDNEVGEVKEIPLFNNESQNYRLELSAIKGFRYEPDEHDNRMILVAVKLDNRSFRYTIIPTEERRFRHICAALFEPIRPGGRRFMREARMSPHRLRIAWPAVPSNLLPVVAAAAEP